MRNVWNDCFYRFLSLAKHVPIILFHYLFFFRENFKKKKIENNGLFVGEKDGSRLKANTRNVNKLRSDC